MRTVPLIVARRSFEPGAGEPYHGKMCGLLGFRFNLRRGNQPCNQRNFRILSAITAGSFIGK
jgi:hypothetical protein